MNKVVFWISKVIGVVTRFPQWWWVLVSISFFLLWWWVFPALSKMFLLWSSSNSTLCWLQKKIGKKLTAPGIPRRSPIQVLTRPNPRLASEIGRVQGGMAVSEGLEPQYLIYTWETTTIIHTIVALCWNLAFILISWNSGGNFCHHIAGTKSFWFSVISVIDNVFIHCFLLDGE